MNGTFYHTILTPHFGALCAATLQVAERLQLSKHFAAFITASLDLRRP